MFKLYETADGRLLKEHIEIPMASTGDVAYILDDGFTPKVYSKEELDSLTEVTADKNALNFEHVLYIRISEDENEVMETLNNLNIQISSMIRRGMNVIELVEDDASNIRTKKVGLHEGVGFWVNGIVGFDMFDAGDGQPTPVISVKLSGVIFLDTLKELCPDLEISEDPDVPFPFGISLYWGQPEEGTLPVDFPEYISFNMTKIDSADVADDVEDEVSLDEENEEQVSAALDNANAIEPSDDELPPWEE